MEEILTYDSVEIAYSGKPVVRELSVTLHEGEILGVVGESGSGKSTLIKAAMGLLGEQGMVTEGDIYFHDKNIPDLTERELRALRGAQIGMIFQDAGASLCPIHTIGYQIHESFCAHERISKNEAKARTLALFAKLQFADTERIWNSYPFELSGGMNQRVGIAMAMLKQPQVLLADEPTSALDVSIQKQVVLELQKLRELFGTALIVVTHDIGVVSALADHVLVMKDGRNVEYGRTDEILSHPQTDYTRQLLDAVPRLRRHKHGNHF